MMIDVLKMEIFSEVEMKKWNYACLVNSSNGKFITGKLFEANFKVSSLLLRIW